MPHYKADGSVTKCAEGSEHTEQLCTQPLEPTRINLCSGGNCEEIKLPEARKQRNHSTRVTIRSIRVIELSRMRK